MLKRGYKLIICLVLVTSLFVGFSVSAFAEPAWLLRAKSAIAAAMFAANLTLEPVDLVLDSTSYPLIDPLGIVDTIGETTIEEYFDKSVIKVLPDVVTIDGVPYSEIWIGPDATDSLRLAGFDFTSAYNILSNQSTAVTYAEGVGFLDGSIPMFSTDTPNTYVSQRYNFNIPSPGESITISFGASDFVFYVDGSTAPTATSATLWNTLTRKGYTSTGTNGLWYRVGKPNTAYIYARYSGTGRSLRTYNNNTKTSYSQTSLNLEDFNFTPFSFDYVSGDIDAPINPEDGLLLRVPSSFTSPSSPQLSYNIHDLINIYPTVETGHDIEIDPALNPDFQTDIDLSNDIGDLIHTILQLLDLLDNSTIEYAPEPVAPDPGPPLPDPDVPISDQDATWLDSLLRWIQQTIDSIKSVGETIHQDIQDLAETLSQLPETILQDIEQAPVKVYQKALDIIKTVFAPVIALLRSVIGLWHYVVEWVTNTAPVFSLFFGLMSSTSYNLVLPIYAGLAGVIVIAVYKRFGK